MFTQNLSKVVSRRGVKIYENTALLSHKANVAKTQHGNITFKKIIFAIDAEYPEENVRKMKSTIVVTSPLKKKEIAETKLRTNHLFIFDSKENYHYLKPMKDNRLLIGFGGIIVHKKHRKTDPHFPHLEQIEKFAKKLLPYLKLKFEYAWSGSFGLTTDFFPFIEHKGASYAIAGCGAQPVCVLSAKHLANKLLGKKSNLDDFFSI